MKILHTSDWHLGKIIYERSLIEDQKAVLSQIIDNAASGGYGAMVIAGDIYDRSIPSPEAVELFSCFLDDLRSATDIPLLIIPGNHDNAVRLSFGAEIMKLGRVYIRTRYEDIVKPVVIENNHFYLFPFFGSGAFSAHSEDEETPALSQDDILREAVKRVQAACDPSAVNICAAHLFTQGGETTDSERVFVGGSGMVNSDAFSPFDYTALGHLHRPQRSGDRVHYSGSILQYSFSEESDEKCFLSVEVKKGAAEVERIPLKPVRKMKRLRAAFHDLLNSPEFAEFTDCYVEAELTDGGLVMNPIELLRNRFPGILSVRQQAVQAAKKESIRINTGSDIRTIEEDFGSFHEYLYGKKPSQERVELFRSLKKEEEL